jgi:hypothetical protein
VGDTVRKRDCCVAKLSPLSDLTDEDISVIRESHREVRPHTLGPIFVGGGWIISHLWGTFEGMSYWIGFAYRLHGKIMFGARCDATFSLMLTTYVSMNKMCEVLVS